ncbi:MAG: hypothetical protein OEV57_03060, partial [Dehalococcoidia bacterium]|nr:hypothetical protein [Dehalococcoidia bacterium]
FPASTSNDQYLQGSLSRISLYSIDVLGPPLPDLTLVSGKIALEKTLGVTTSDGRSQHQRIPTASSSASFYSS